MRAINPHQNLLNKVVMKNVVNALLELVEAGRVRLKMDNGKMGAGGKIRELIIQDDGSRLFDSFNKISHFYNDDNILLERVLELVLERLILKFKQDTKRNMSSIVKLSSLVNHCKKLDNKSGLYLSVIGMLRNERMLGHVDFMRVLPWAKVLVNNNTGVSDIMTMSMFDDIKRTIKHKLEICFDNENIALVYEAGLRGITKLIEAERVLARLRATEELESSGPEDMEIEDSQEEISTIDAEVEEDSDYLKDCVLIDAYGYAKREIQPLLESEKLDYARLEEAVRVLFDDYNLSIKEIEGFSGDLKDMMNHAFIRSIVTVDSGMQSEVLSLFDGMTLAVNYKVQMDLYYKKLVASKQEVANELPKNHTVEELRSKIISKGCERIRTELKKDSPNFTEIIAIMNDVSRTSNKSIEELVKLHKEFREVVEDSLVVASDVLRESIGASYVQIMKDLGVHKALGIDNTKDLIEFLKDYDKRHGGVLTKRAEEYQAKPKEKLEKVDLNRLSKEISASIEAGLKKQPVDYAAIIDVVEMANKYGTGTVESIIKSEPAFKAAVEHLWYECAVGEKVTNYLGIYLMRLDIIGVSGAIGIYGPKDYVPFVRNYYARSSTVVCTPVFKEDGGIDFEVVTDPAILDEIANFLSAPRPMADGLNRK